MQCTTYNDIIESNAFPDLGQQCGEDSLLLQHDRAPVHQVRSRLNWFYHFGVEELDRPADS